MQNLRESKIFTLIFYFLLNPSNALVSLYLSFNALKFFSEKGEPSLVEGK